MQTNRVRAKPYFTEIKLRDPGSFLRGVGTASAMRPRLTRDTVAVSVMRRPIARLSHRAGAKPTARAAAQFGAARNVSMSHQGAMGWRLSTCRGQLQR